MGGRGTHIIYLDVVFARKLDAEISQVTSLKKDFINHKMANKYRGLIYPLLTTSDLYGAEPVVIRPCENGVPC